MPARHAVGAAGDDRYQTQEEGRQDSSIDGPEIPRGLFAPLHHDYDRHDYSSAIEQLSARPRRRRRVANLIGYSYRKLGN